MKSLYFEVKPARILATKALGQLFPQVFFSRLSPVRYGDIPRRELPGAQFVRVRPQLAGICGADLALFFVMADPRISIAALPGVPRAYLGHELIGTVTETGAGVGHLAVGDRVTLQRYLPCCSSLEIDPPCEFCREGHYTLCENFSAGKLPEHLGAGFSEEFIAHTSQLLKVPDLISDDEAVLIEPASVSLHAVLRRPPVPGEKVLVIGAGTIGLNVIPCAKVLCPDCELHLAEKMAFKQELGLKLGAEHVLTGDLYEAVGRATGAKVYRGALKNTTLLGGFDLIYDCVGSPATVQDALRWLKARGTYLMIGNKLSPLRFDQTPLWNQELTLLGINSHGGEDLDGRRVSTFELAMEMIAEKRITLAGFITHRFGLDDYRQAFALVRDKPGQVIKVVFEMGGAKKAL